MSAPKSLPLKVLVAGADVIGFINNSLMTVLRLWQQKLFGMMNEPAVFALPFWDGQTWKSVQLGTRGPALPDASSPIFVSDGNHRVATDATCTADRTYFPASGFDTSPFDTMFFWNLTTLHTLTISLTGDDMVLSPMYRGTILFRGGAWVGTELVPVTVDPGVFE